MTRIVELPFTYKMRGQLRGKRNRSNIFVRDTMPVEIREIAAADAPVAFVATHRDGREEIRTELRAFEGRPMKRLIGPGWAWHTKGNPLTLANLEGELAALAPNRPMFWDELPIDVARCGNHASARTTLQQRADISFKEIEIDDREKEMSRASARLAHLVSIDGEIWIETSEPAWVVRIPERRSNDRVTITLDMSERKETDLSPSFRVDRLGDALRFATHIAERRGLRSDDPDDRVEMTGDLRWSFDDATRYLHGEAAYIQILGQSKHLSDMPTAFFPMFVMNREFAWERDHSKAQAVAQRDNLRTMLDLLKAIPSDYRNDMANEMQDRLEVAMWRLDTLEAGFEQGPPEMDDDALGEAIAP